MKDEIEYNLLRDSHPNPLAKAVEANFRRNLVKDKDGFDETKYRVRLVELRREFMEQLRHPAPKDESGGRLAFEKMTLKDSATEFITELINEVTTGKGPKRIYERQKKIALDRKLIEKTGLIKKYFHWIVTNKFFAATLLLSTTIVLFCLFYWFLYWIFA